MSTVQGNLINHEGDKVVPNTLTSAVYDAAKEQALSQTLLNTPDKTTLGYPTFSTVLSYAIGDVVYYNSKLYKFTSAHAAGAWLGSDATVVSLDDLKADKDLDAVSGNVAVFDANGNVVDSESALTEFAKTADLEGGDIVPKEAETLESWEERDDPTVEDTFTDTIRTTAGDSSVNSDAGATLVSIVAKTDFSATAFMSTGFNLLHYATSVGSGYYFYVPKLTFGTYGTSEYNNGVLFTDANGNNLTPTVYFKALSSGVPTGVTDGTACAYTDSNNHRFYTTSGEGFLIVSGITIANTCAHIAWSRRYDEFISYDDANDAGSSIALSTTLAAVHSDTNSLLVVGSTADRMDFGTSAVVWTRNVGRVAPTWTTEESSETSGTYIHTATISGMLNDGAAEFESENITLSVGGTTISYTDNSSTASTDYVKYELDTPVTGSVSVSPTLTIEDWGVEVLTGASGEAYVTILYAQSYADALAAIVQYRMGDVEDAVESNESRVEELEEAVVEDVNSADFDELPKLCGQPMILFSNGTPAEATVPDNWIGIDEGGYAWNGVPSALGQTLINYAVTSGGHYTAVRDGSYGLKWINS